MRSPPVLLLLAALVGACTRAQPDPSVLVDGGAAATAGGAEAGVTATTAAETDAADAGRTALAPDASAPGPDEVTLIATTLEAPILSATEWPAHDPARTTDERQGVIRLGHLRRGSHAIAKREIIKKASCAEGWYELVAGGFVCGKYATIDPAHKDLKFAPHAPWLERNLPYEYGLNLTPGTPLYRHLPQKSERKEIEKTLAFGKGGNATELAKKLKDSGQEVPAYLKDTSAKPRVGFKELRGDPDLVAQRMLKGFYLSLDKKVDAKSGVFFHTVSGLMAPKDHLIVHDPKTEFDGVRLDAPGEKRKLPLAFVVTTSAKKIAFDGTSAEVGDKIERFSIIGLTGKRESKSGRVYHETDQGFWVRGNDVAVVHQPKTAADITPGERWIDVDLSNEALVAFEGEKPVFATIVSTGRRSSDPAKDHPTAEGTFRVREKYITTTMDDDGASDGTYRIEDVPWVMYFDKSIALHGAFWHSGFGRQRSHGCVNLTPHDARILFGWAGPSLPEGWHGVRATKQNPGTRVVVHK